MRARLSAGKKSFARAYASSRDSLGYGVGGRIRAGFSALYHGRRTPDVDCLCHWVADSNVNWAPMA